MAKTLLLGFYLMVPALVLSTGILQLKTRLELTGRSGRRMAARITQALLAMAAGMGIAAIAPLLPLVDWNAYLSLIGQSCIGWQ